MRVRIPSVTLRTTLFSIFVIYAAEQTGKAQAQGDRRDEKHDDLQKYREQSEALPGSPETSIQYTLVREAEHAHTREDPYGCISVSGFPFIADMDRFPERGKRFFYGPLCVRSQFSTVIATHQAQTPELRVQIPQGLLMGYSYNG